MSHSASESQGWGEGCDVGAGLQRALSAVLRSTDVILR